jgi:hypothetical protein
MKVVGDEATLQSSTTSFGKIIKKLDALFVQEECRMLAQVITNRNYVICNQSICN